MTQAVSDDVFRRMVGFRRDLHQYPELSNKEVRTAGKVAAALKEMNIPFREGIGGTGIVADIPGPDQVPRVALRADMDALPIQEETGLDFASEVEGVMHACGHDGHVSMLLGAADILSREKNLPAPIRLIFQPGEENGTGARIMIDAGVLERVGYIFGGHLDRHYPAGTLAFSEGAMNASSDRFHIRIEGKDTHAARPHEGVDAVVVGSLMITALQTIVSREVNPAFPSVVTVGKFQAGTASNVIAGTADLMGTIRAQHPQVRDHLKQSLERMAQSVAQLHGAAVKVEFLSGTPALINQADMVALATRAAHATAGKERTVPLRTANMGGEDFSYFLEKVPGCYIRIGGQVPGREGFPAHSSRFDFDEAALATGAAFYCAIARMAGEELAGRKS